jgi:peptide/nickel transport system permease protein
MSDTTVPPPGARAADGRGRAAPEPEAEPGYVSLRRQRWRRFRANRVALVSAIFIVALGVLSLLAPLLSPYDPTAPAIELIQAPPTLAHPLGADTSGRDILSRLLYGGRVSLAVGLVAVSIYTVIGTTIGAVAGFRRGAIDGILMRLTDTVMSFPALIIMMAILPILGSGALNIMLALGLLGWPVAARLVRGQFLALREQEFVLAARGLGVRDSRLILDHLLPNVVGPLVVLASFGIADAIIAEAGLSLLGLGVQPPDFSWGQMLAQALDVGTLLTFPWMWIPPAIAIALTVLAFNFVGDALRDTFDPRSSLRLP